MSEGQKGGVSPAQPEVFGKYHLLEKIATGGMAEVFRARSYGMAGFEKILVIKRILDHLSRDDEFIKLFIDEARIAVSLLHVNIVQVFDLGEVDGKYYMAMEYVHGLDMARLVARSQRIGPYPVALACFVVTEVLKALQFAHQRRDEDGKPLDIVHCDISPQNVLVSFAGEVKITDFGISRAGFQATTHEVIRGKYAYMSPEQVEGRHLDGRSDLFSLAIVLYELLTGRRLFKARNRDETLLRVRRAEVPSPRSYRAELSEELEAFLLKALARRPEDRFQEAAEMHDALSQLMVREGIRVTNHDLATFVKRVVEAADEQQEERRRPARHVAPSAIVVLACEASPPPRSIAAPRATLAAMSQEWTGVINESGAEIWERSEGGALVVWVARGGMKEALSRAVNAAKVLQQITVRAGYRLSAGLAPGVARIDPDTRRPGDGWELAGPFYLARWMMNLSAHRGRVLLTEMGAKQVPHSARVLGRIPIQGNRYITLHELD